MPRHLAIGDIHGCFQALTTLMDFAELRPDDQLITLGDYVDRGPNSYAVLDWLIYHHQQGRLIPLKGNHEVMMLASREHLESFDSWLACGGQQTLQSYSPFDGDDPGSLADIPQTHWDFLENDLRSYYEIETHFFVHANAYPEVPLADQPENVLFWQSYNNPPRHISGKIMVCGHTSQRSGMPKTNGEAICIDTRAYGRGWLSCLEIETGIVYQAKQDGETRKLYPDEYEN